MHMADALISPVVAGVAGAVSLTLIAVAATKAQKETSRDSVSMMGVLGAFVFAAQMINFSIPGTGSSGHIIGGILLSALLGPWCGFLTLCSVLIVQCLVFADGGLMALGCNILNMGAMTCLVAYPLIFKPLMKYPASSARLMWVSILACIVGLELGAFAVTIETVSSGITALPFGKFLLFMLPIHLAIGLGEGAATGAILIFVKKNSPALLNPFERVNSEKTPEKSSGKRRVVIFIVSVAVIFAIAFAWIASGNPDGLEWSIEQITGSTELAPANNPATAFMPDYESHFSGIVGGIIVMMMVWAITSLILRNRKSPAVVQNKNVGDRENNIRS